MKKAHTVTTAKGKATAKATPTTTTTTTTATVAKTTTTTTVTTTTTTTIIYLPPFCDPCKHVPAPTTTNPTKPATTTATATTKTSRVVTAKATTTIATATATRAKTSATGSSSISTGDGDCDVSSDSGNVTTKMSTTCAETMLRLKTMANGSSGIGIGIGSGNGSGSGSECDYGSCCQRRWEHKNYDKHATSTLTPTTKPTATTAAAATAQTTVTTLPVSATETTAAAPATAAAFTTTRTAFASMEALRRPASLLSLQFEDTQEENRIIRNTNRVASNEGVAADGGTDADANDVGSFSSIGTHWNLLRLQQKQLKEVDVEKEDDDEGEVEVEGEEEGIIVKQRIALDTDTQSKKACSNNSNNITRPSDLRHKQQQKHRTANDVDVNVNVFVNEDADEDVVDADVVYADNEIRNNQVGEAEIEVADNGAVDVSILADSIKLRNTKLVMPIEVGVVQAPLPAAVAMMAVRTTAECRLENVTTMRNTSSSAVEIAPVVEESTATAVAATATATAAAAMAMAAATAATRQSYASLTQNNATATKAKAPTAEKTKTETATNTNTNRNTTKTTTEMVTATAKATATATKDSNTTITTLHDDECRCFKYNGDISTLEGVSRNFARLECECCSSYSSSSCSFCCCYCEKKKNKKKNEQHLTKSEAEAALKQQKQEEDKGEGKEEEQQEVQDYLIKRNLVEEESSLPSFKQAQAQEHEQNERKLRRLNGSHSRSNSSSRSITLLKFWQQLVHKSEATMVEAAAWNWNWCGSRSKSICATVSENASSSTMMLATAASATATTTTTTTTTTTPTTTATATTITSVKNAVATFSTRTKTMPTITSTTTTTAAATKSWLSLLMMLMLTTTANCWGGRQDAPTNCTFPARWEGSWFLSGYQQSIHIKGSSFSYRGRCAATDGNKYLIVDEKGCHRCLVIYEKHKNVLQYKESECEGDSMYMHQTNPSALAIRSSLKQTSDHRGGAHPNTNGHSRLSSSDQYIMRSNDDMNDYFCKGRETLQNLCDQIPGDALLYSLFRESAEPVKCPLKGPFIFTYNRGHGECKSPVSNIESCTEDSRLLLSFQACPDVLGTESTVEELTCLATWKDGNSRYLVGLVSHHHAISNEERYRCFVYEKISSLMGGPSILSSKDAEYKLAQSGDATCNGLDSAEVGSRIMSLRKPPLAERCDFPVWFKGPRHWHVLMGNAIYNYHSNDGSVHIIKSNGYMETRALCEQINKQTATEMMAVVHYTTGCQSGFMCMMFYRRDTHVIEIQTGKPAIRLEDACAPEYFDINKMAYITLLATNPDPQICPMEGLYNLRGAIGPPYLTTRHKRNHNNKVHLGHGHHHQHDGDAGNNGFGHKRHSTLSFRNAERIDRGSWHANTRGLPVRSRRNANELAFVKQTNSTKEILLSATAPAANETSVGFVTRNRRDVPGCVTNYKAQRQLWIGCTEANVIDVRPMCNVDGEEEYSCHGSWSENGTVYIIARHKSTKHAVCISYQPTEGTAAKLVIGDACYRGTQKPPDHHLVANLSVFGKCGETGSAATRIQVGNWLINAVVTFIALLLGSQLVS